MIRPTSPATTKNHNRCRRRRPYPEPTLNRVQTPPCPIQLRGTTGRTPPTRDHLLATAVCTASRSKHSPSKPPLHSRTRSPPSTLPPSHTHPPPNATPPRPPTSPHPPPPPLLPQPPTPHRRPHLPPPLLRPPTPPPPSASQPPSTLSST